MARQEIRYIPIYCDCCGRERLATIIDDGKGLKLSMRDRRHGKTHYFSEKLDTLAKSCGTVTRKEKGGTDGGEKERV